MKSRLQVKSGLGRLNIQTVLVTYGKLYMPENKRRYVQDSLEGRYSLVLDP